MENGVLNLEELCRRQWRRRTAAIRNTVDRRRAAMEELAANLPDQAHQTQIRLLRARTSGTQE